MVFSKVIQVALAGFAVLAQATKNTLDAGIVSEAAAARSLEVERKTQTSERLQSLRDALRTTFGALPKNDKGNLGHDAVRYALHRMFIQRHGWFIKGLEPGSARRSEGESEWVPDYLQSMLEAQLGGRGASLEDLAALAASLEDLVDFEAHGRLGVAYDMLGFAKDAPLTEEQARLAMQTYYISFLLSGNFSADSRWEVDQNIKWFTSTYEDWGNADRWLQDQLAPRFAAKVGQSFTFEDAALMAESIGENYYTFNDGECRDLKTELGGLEGIKAGRVRLSFFYSKGLHSHWRFNERQEYLRVLGALDETDAASPQVIVPNYVMARPNCLEASGLYAICCRNECEDLMGHLELQLGAATAEPKRIAELVAALPSDTVAAPRALPASLRTRLDEVASSNGGKVPLHGRLFAQWMHHAYPRECPYPHEAGVNPQTPDEWMASQKEGAAGMSREEMQQAVEADQCASGLASGKLPSAKDCGSATGGDLPWLPQEELLVSTPRSEAQPDAKHSRAMKALAKEIALKNAVAEPVAEARPAVASSWTLLDVAAVVVLIAYLSFQMHQKRTGRGSFKLKDEVSEELGQLGRKINFQAVSALAALATLAFLLGLLDGVVFGCAALAGAASLAVQHFSRTPQPTLPLYGKCDDKV